jgi:hypothetical protein
VTAPKVLPHLKAMKSALEAVLLTVYVGGAPQGVTLPKQFVVLYADPGRATAASLAVDRTVLDVLVQATCVATTPEGALDTRDLVAQALDGPLTVAGRESWKPELVGGPPEQRDDDVTPPLWFLPVQYRLASIPT